jgi:hypothetical protein
MSWDLYFVLHPGFFRGQQGSLLYEELDCLWRQIVCTQDN